MPLLSVDRVSFKYGEQWVLRGIRFEVEKGDFLGVIGPNGSGKTTLLRVIDGILKPQEGEVRLEETEIGRLRREALARSVAVVPQYLALAFPFSVEEVVLMGRSPHLGRWRFEGEKDLRIAREAMMMTDTLGLAARDMGSLSGGECQRVLIARALAQEPRLILLDEPTAFLDIRHQADFFDRIRALNRERELTVIAVTHDINLAAHYCGRVILLKDGRIEAAGPVESVITEEHIRKAYETTVLVDRHPVTGSPRITLT
ncbi:MAG: Hemin import ATP-binding protein HmuV [Syntrophaceae bacterium PtaB.Bin038]|nr:MAG: Hemin import ATP-binding protein HmuV [Syntrophaceae bacterium PtaB.Bin038]